MKYQSIFILLLIVDHILAALYKNHYQYAVVIDAGSSGSRAYLYKWPQHSGDPKDLLLISPVMSLSGKPLYKKVMPGLSGLKDKPEDALEYIRPLLTFAQEHIPRHKIHETPLYILATAGMRMLEPMKQEAILSSVRNAVENNFDFLFPDGNLEVISGKQEGIYQWLAINYVLGKFDNDESGDSLVALEPKSDYDHVVLRPRTVGAIDMGGASMQIAMEITSKLQLEGMSVSYYA